MPRSLTVLIPVRNGEAEPLRDILRAIGDDIRGRTAAAGEARPHIDFILSRTVHFARFAMLRDPARGPGATRLLFSSVYDGTLGDHLDDLRAITSDLDAIWGRCQGYPGREGFPAFVRAHALDPSAVYAALPDECVATIRHAQFEFVQQSWCNNPRFGGLTNNKDPIIGDNAPDGRASQMEIPAAAGRHQNGVASAVRGRERRSLSLHAWPGRHPLPVGPPREALITNAGSRDEGGVRRHGRSAARCAVPPWRAAPDCGHPARSQSIRREGRIAPAVSDAIAR